MYIYLVKPCFNSETVLMSASTALLVGQAISYAELNSEDSLCGEVIAETVGTVTHYFVSYQQSCCDCVISSTLTESFSFAACSGLTTIEVGLLNFCSIYGDVPQIGQTFRLFNTGTSESICGTLVSVNRTYEGSNWIPDEGPFLGCSNCEPDIPKSAGTESFICEVCCPCTSGGTITSVAPPHPVWTDNQGVSVTQLNMVVLGGENGLNS